jgi:hypothetical protein
MAQEIHLDSLDDGWSFLTAMEGDQELLVLWNGFRSVCVMKEIAADRAAACDLVRTILRSCKPGRKKNGPRRVELAVFKAHREKVRCHAVFCR